jgi:CarD family transcriptional regulator
MMKFNIGETIIEPTNGICIMEGMRRMKVDGKEMTVYIFMAQNAKVYVPADQIENRNIRRPMDREEVKKVLVSLKQPVSPNRDDARLQYTNYREIMKSGDPMKIAKLLRELYILDQADDLKGKEKEIMEQAKKFICDEIAFIRQASKTTVMEQINEALRQMYKKKIAKDKERAKKSGTGLPMEILGYEEDEELLDEDASELLEEEEEAEAASKKKAKKGTVLAEEEVEEVVEEEEEEEE